MKNHKELLNDSEQIEKEAEFFAKSKNEEKNGFHYFIRNLKK